MGIIYDRRRVVGGEGELFIQDFDYTGAAQTITLKKGSYRLQCWGAQGGWAYSESYPGGKGGYSEGVLTLTSTTTAYVYVGGKGGSSKNADGGGFNGGGNHGSCSSTATTVIAGGGGGASDIRLGTDAYAYRVIVAGGGGGQGIYNQNYTPGYGGGTSGGNGLYSGSTYQTRCGSGATQTAGGAKASSGSTSATAGSFGVGGKGQNGAGGGAGGGGGWYGGGGAGSGNTLAGAGGGGSGYVHQGTNTASSLGQNYILSNAFTSGGNATFISVNGEAETGHENNGYARISQCRTKKVNVTLNRLSNEPFVGATISIGGVTGTTDSDGKVTLTVPVGTSPILVEGFITTPSTVTVDKNMSISVTAYILKNYDYTGAVQQDTLPPGTYKLEVWGARGGSYSDTYHGGYGGYSVGELTLTASTQIYVRAGGSATTSTSSGSTTGGFNGGGNAYGSSSYLAKAGGGASDIRIGQDSLYARVIVAGGGGGFAQYSSSYRYSGGYGGGTSGGSGTQYSTSYRAASGGTQTARGSSYYQTTANSTTYGTLAAFGTGGGRSGTSTSYSVAGGGGGWYGGGYAYRASAGGGSGYIYTSATASNYPSGCLLNSSYYLTNAQTIAGNASMPSVNGGTETGHNGSGYVRITEI